MFSLEELHRNFTPVILLCVMASSMVADFISKSFLGVNPAFAFDKMNPLPLDKYFHLIILGIITGVMGAIFNFAILKSQDGYKSVKKVKTRYKAMFPFLLVGILGFIMPDMLGGGHELVEKLNTQSFTLSVLLLFIVIKLVFTAICYGSGVPGGIFLPLLVILWCDCNRLLWNSRELCFKLYNLVNGSILYSYNTSTYYRKHIDS